MKDMPDASGPPYPYPEPLPVESKQAHLGAAQAWQKRINFWNGLVFFPGIVLVIISLFWGRTRSADPEDLSLWESNPLAAAILLYGGLALFAVGTAAIVWLARKKGRHMKLLKTYGIHINPSTTKEVTGAGAAR